MATYKSVYDQAKKDSEAAALKKYNELSAVNSQSVNDYIKQLSAATDASTKIATDNINKTIGGLPQQYQKSYDTNAIQQLVNERQVEERMANLGLTDSGLNRTQQTAINIQRSNSDAALSQQQNSAVSALKQQISDYVASAEAKKLQTTSEAKYNLAQQNNTLKQNLLSAADENATSYANSWQDQQNKLAEQAAAAQRAAQAAQEATAKAYKSSLSDLRKQLNSLDDTSGNFKTTVMRALLGAFDFDISDSDLNSLLNAYGISKTDFKNWITTGDTGATNVSKTAGGREIWTDNSGRLNIGGH